MRDIGTGVLPADRACDLLRCGCGFGVDDPGLDRLALQERSQIVLVRQRLARRPCCALAQSFQRSLGAVLGFADDAREAAVPHDGDEPANRARCRFIERDELCVRHLGPQHTAMQHVRQRRVVNEARPREHLIGNVDPLNRLPGNAARGGRLRDRFRGRAAIERDLAGELPVAGPDIARSGHRAIIDVERRCFDAEPLRRCCEEQPAHLGADLAKRAARLLDREAARGDAFVRASRR